MITKTANDMKIQITSESIMITLIIDYKKVINVNLNNVHYETHIMVLQMEVHYWPNWCQHINWEPKSIIFLIHEFSLQYGIINWKLWWVVRHEKHSNWVNSIFISGVWFEFPSNQTVIPFSITILVNVDHVTHCTCN